MGAREEIREQRVSGNRGHSEFVRPGAFPGPVAKAVVTKMGGILSHAAIVARGYGTPCVVDVKGITGVLEDGDLIEVDGKNGTVKVIACSSELR